MASKEINNTQASHGHSCSPIGPFAEIVGTAMFEGHGHRRETIAIDLPIRGSVDDSANAAHELAVPGALARQ